MAVVLVFGGYLVWTGIIEWMEKGSGKVVAQATQQAEATDTAARRPTFIIFPSHTPLPTCQTFYVDVTSAFVRQCPEFDCKDKALLRYQAEVCVYSRASRVEFPNADAPDEWYEIDLDPGAIFPEIGYMHESVIKPRFPTPRPTRTFTPLPTITETPPPTLAPSPTGPTRTPGATDTPLPATPTPAPTSVQIQF
jgi:hypothetical protein